jgi:hypothetical protein
MFDVVSTKVTYMKGMLKLYQSGAIRGAWKMRYFILTNEKLEYYKDEQVCRYRLVGSVSAWRVAVAVSGWLIESMDAIVAQATSLVKEVPLGSIILMQKDKGKVKERKEIGAIAHIATNDTKLSIGFMDEMQVSQWLLAIDGLRGKVYGSCLDSIERVCRCADHHHQ